MKFKHIWDLNYKKVLLSYFFVSLLSSIIEIFLTGSFQWSFILTYLGVFFISPYLRRGINEFFKQFHVKKVIRNLLEPWIIFGIVYLYVLLFFNFYYLKYGVNIGFGPTSSFIIFFGIIVLILFSINHIIRILAVAFHRRKSNLFPINRVEYAALQYLKQKNEVNFIELKDQIKGIINIFIPEVYFNDETATASIYHLCGIRLADINAENVVSLNKKGKKEYTRWKETLDHQIKAYTKILNSKGVLIRSFIGLLILSLLKIFIGTSSSESLRAEGIENFLDCIAVILIGFGIKFKKEKLINSILIILMIFASLNILYESISSLIIGPKAIEVPQIIILIGIISISLNTYLRVIKNFVGKKNRNSSLVASAIDSKINILISVGIILGALLSEFGRAQGIPFLFYCDPIIAIIVSSFIFKEAIEIFREFLTRKGEDIEFEKFQMPYEENFMEYIIKWILSRFIDQLNSKFTLKDLNQQFRSSLKKSEDIYTDFSYFGLYLFKEHGINSVVNNLIDEGFLSKENGKLINLTKKGIFMYEHFYSKPLIEDIKDPFDFFFEQNYDFDSLKRRKNEKLERYNQEL